MLNDEPNLFEYQPMRKGGCAALPEACAESMAGVGDTHTHAAISSNIHAGFKEPTTSQDAAIEIEARGVAAYIRRRVLDSLCDFGAMTADECAELIGKSILATRPRFSELKRDGLIRDTGMRRKNASGMKAKVWEAV